MPPTRRRRRTGEAVPLRTWSRGLTRLLRPPRRRRTRRGPGRLPRRRRRRRPGFRPDAGDVLRQPRAAAAGRVRLPARPGQPHRDRAAATGRVVDVTLELEGYDERPGRDPRPLPVHAGGSGRFCAGVGHRPGLGATSTASDPQPWDDGPVDGPLRRRRARHLRRRERTRRPATWWPTCETRHRRRRRRGARTTGSRGWSSTRSPTPLPVRPRGRAGRRPAGPRRGGLPGAGAARTAARSPTPGSCSTRGCSTAPGQARARLIRHELTHVAVGDRADGVPTWLSEGIAEYVSVRPIPPEDRVMSEEALAAAEAGLTGLPGDEDVQRVRTRRGQLRRRLVGVRVRRRDVRRGPCCGSCWSPCGRRRTPTRRSSRPARDRRRTRWPAARREADAADVRDRPAGRRSPSDSDGIGCFA